MANDVIEMYGAATGSAPNYNDRVFDATALPNATTLTSGIFRFGKVQGRTELRIFANSLITIADGATLAINLLFDEDKDGSFATSKSLAAYAPSGAAQEVAAGALMVNYTHDSDVDHYCKVEIVASADQSAGSVNSNIYRIA